MRAVPAVRVSAIVRAPIMARRYVLYWMIAARRTRSSFALQHAIVTARELGLPLVVLEALRVGYRWASSRLHRFVIDGMADHAARFAATPIAYHPYTEPTAGHGAGLLEALATDAALVVTDDWPCFFVPRMVAAAARELDALGVRLEAVDGNGLLPLAAADRTFTAAVHFRRCLQKTLPLHLAAEAWPEPDPLRHARDLPRAVIPRSIAARWPAASDTTLRDPSALIASLPIDHAVPIVGYRGGEVEADRLLARFVDDKLARYADRNHPAADVASGLSPYLHFGHASAHAFARAVLERDGWDPAALVSRTANGRREGWWGLSPAAEAFLDQLVTWRELGFNACAHEPDGYDRYEAIPDWARATLAAHARDPRPWLYSRDQLEAAATHDPLWNAAQTELRREGRIHNYLRMLWGKKILEWSATPEDALATLVALNDRWSTDGRDPNSYSSLTWILGRYDRPWGPARPIFGTVRFMSSDSAAKKLRLGDYLERYGGARGGKPHGHV